MGRGGYIQTFRRIRPQSKRVSDYWLAYYVSGDKKLCLICENSGRIPSTNPDLYCICPNGQSMRAAHQQLAGVDRS